MSKVIKFTVDERVRCINASNSDGILVEGALYIVEKLSANRLLKVRAVNSLSHGTVPFNDWSTERFVPYFEGVNVGDTVRILNSHWTLPGYIFKVAKISRNNYYKKVLESPTGYKINPFYVEVIKKADKEETVPESKYPEIEFKDIVPGMTVRKVYQDISYQATVVSVGKNFICTKAKNAMYDYVNATWYLIKNPVSKIEKLAKGTYELAYPDGKWEDLSQGAQNYYRCALDRLMKEYLE